MIHLAKVCIIETISKDTMLGRCFTREVCRLRRAGQSGEGFVDDRDGESPLFYVIIQKGSVLFRDE